MSERQTQEQRRQTSEQRLLDTAAQEFARHGVDQSTLAQIGDRAGYSRGLANHRFGSKAALVQTLARRTQTQFVEQLGTLEGDAVDVLVAMANTYLDALERQRDSVHAFLVMWGAALPENALLRPLFASFDAEFRGHIETAIRHGQRQKTIGRTVDPVAMAVVVVGAIRGIAEQYLVNPDIFVVDDLKSSCEHMLRRTLAPG